MDDPHFGYKPKKANFFFKKILILNTTPYSNPLGNSAASSELEKLLKGRGQGVFGLAIPSGSIVPSHAPPPPGP